MRAREGEYDKLRMDAGIGTKATAPNGRIAFPKPKRPPMHRIGGRLGQQ